MLRIRTHNVGVTLDTNALLWGPWTETTVDYEMQCGVVSEVRYWTINGIRCSPTSAR